MRVFISYPTKDGLDVATKARKLFERAGHKAWMWEHSRTPGALTWREISNCIASDTDLFFYICTSSSCASYGQALEAGYALNNRVNDLVVRLGPVSVPIELTARNYETWERGEFYEKCRGLANNLPETMDRIRRLDPASSPRQEPSRVAERLTYVRDLNARTAQLDGRRVTECKDAVWRSYEAATLPRKIASLSQESKPEAPGFRRIELWARVNLSEFNDPKFYWGPYFSDVGRAVAREERKYLQAAVMQEISEHAATISRSNPQFDVLTSSIQTLAQGALVPDTLLAPVQMEVPFHRFYRDQLGWSDGARWLTVGDVRLRLLWSHKYAPLDCFVVFSSRSGTWHVVPDQETGRAVTIALGQSRLYPDEVEYGVETVVRYEVTDPSGFRIMRLTV